MTTHSDAELLSLISKDNHAAFGEIWNRYRELGYNTAYKRLKNAELSKDAVQDVFTAIWVRRSAALSIKNLPAYINSAIQYNAQRALSAPTDHTAFFEVFETIAGTAAGADSPLLEKELTHLAYSWLDKLPGKKQEIFLLHYRENMSTKEIAALLNISQKTVQNQLGLATKKIILHFNS